MKDTILRYLRMPGTWAGLTSVLSGAAAAKWGEGAGALVSHILVFVGGVLIAAPV